MSYRSRVNQSQYMGRRQLELTLTPLLAWREHTDESKSTRYHFVAQRVGCMQPGGRQETLHFVQSPELLQDPERGNTIM